MWMHEESIGRSGLLPIELFFYIPPLIAGTGGEVPITRDARAADESVGLGVVAWQAQRSEVFGIEPPLWALGDS